MISPKMKRPYSFVRFVRMYERTRFSTSRIAAGENKEQIDVLVCYELKNVLLD